MRKAEEKLNVKFTAKSSQEGPFQFKLKILVEGGVVGLKVRV